MPRGVYLKTVLTGIRAAPNRAPWHHLRRIPSCMGCRMFSFRRTFRSLSPIGQIIERSRQKSVRPPYSPDWDDKQNVRFPSAWIQAENRVAYNLVS